MPKASSQKSKRAVAAAEGTESFSHILKHVPPVPRVPTSDSNSRNLVSQSAVGTGKAQAQFKPKEFVQHLKMQEALRRRRNESDKGDSSTEEHSDVEREKRGGGDSSTEEHGDVEREKRGGERTPPPTEDSTLDWDVREESPEGESLFSPFWLFKDPDGPALATRWHAHIVKVKATIAPGIAEAAAERLRTACLSIDIDFIRRLRNHTREMEAFHPGNPPEMPLPPAKYMDWVKNVWRKYVEGHGQNPYPATPQKYKEFERSLVISSREIDKYIALCSRYLEKCWSVYDKMAPTLSVEEKTSFASSSNPWERGKVRDDDLPSTIPIVPFDLQRDPGAPAVVEIDRTAPKLSRHWYVTHFTDVDGPEGRIRVLTNVGYMFEIPEATYPLRYSDGSFGPHEESRYPQFHAWHRWHMAFIPLRDDYDRNATQCFDGLVHVLRHSATFRDMAWYDINENDLDQQPADNLYRVQQTVINAMTRDWNKSYKEYIAARMAAPHITGHPIDIIERASRAHSFLAGNTLTLRDLTEAMAGWQRGLLELRGFTLYVEVQTQQRSRDERLKRVAIQYPARHKMAVRGVFTYNKEVADRVAQFGVPVWFITTEGQKHFQNFDWKEIPRDKIFQAQHSDLSWNDSTVPAYSRSLTYHAQPSDGSTSAAPTDPRLPPPDRTTGSADFNGDVDDEGGMNYSNNDFYELPPSMEVVEPMDVDQAQPGPSNSRKRKRKKQSREGQPEAKKPRQLQGVPAQGKGDAKPLEPSLYVAPKNPPVFPWGKDGVPEWYPTAWAPAMEYVHTTDIGKARGKRLANTPDFPVPQTPRSKLTRFRMPVPQHFGNVRHEGMKSRMFAVWTDIGECWTQVLESHAVGDVAGFTTAEWKAVMKGFTAKEDTADFARRLGIANRARAGQDAATTVVEEQVQHILMAPKEVPAERARTPYTEYSSPSATSFSMPTTAPTSPPASPPGRGPYDDDDDEREDEEEEETALPFDEEVASQLLRLPTGNERPLAVEAERYLYEPTGWRMKGVGQMRGLGDFQWYKEEDSDFDDGIPMFCGIGATANRQALAHALATLDTWCSFEEGICFFFRNWLTPEHKHALGERQTKPLRLCLPAQKRQVKTEPREFRIWQQLDWKAPLELPLEPMGPVGALWKRKSRNAAKYNLPQAVVLKLFPVMKPFYDGTLKWDRSSLATPTTSASGTISALAPRSTSPASAAPPSPTAPATPATAPSTATTVSAASSTATSSTSAAIPALAPPVTSATSTSIASHAPPSTAAHGWPASTNSFAPHALAPPSASTAPHTSVAPSTPTSAAPPALALPSTDVPYQFLRQYYAPPGPRMFAGHPLPPYAPPDDNSTSYSWPPPAWRKYIMWHLLEMSFRYELYALDDAVRVAAYPDSNINPLQRHQQLCAIWATASSPASASFVPHDANPLTSEDWQERVVPIRLFHGIVSSWPRVTDAPISLLPCPVNFADEGEFINIERRVWVAFAQTYFDYFAREAPLPSVRPAAPWS